MRLLNTKREIVYLGVVLLFFISMFFPVPFRGKRADSLRDKMRQIYLACVAFRGDHGHYPGKIEEIVPRYIAIPLDECRGVFLVRPHSDLYGDEYFLYLIGIRHAIRKGVVVYVQPRTNQSITCEVDIFVLKRYLLFLLKASSTEKTYSPEGIRAVKNALQELSDET